MGMIINPYRFSSAVPLLLDTYTGAAAAYSLRKLRTAYTGYCIEVRRSSDDTTLNIGFTAAGVLDESALTTFCGAGDGFVRTWYDQSTNGRNATQATASSQPQIVDDGTVLSLNSKPALLSIFGNSMTPSSWSAGFGSGLYSAVFYVGLFNNTGVVETVIKRSTGQYGLLVYKTTADKLEVGIGGISVICITANAISLNTQNLFTILVKYTTINEGIIYIDNESKGTGIRAGSATNTNAPNLFENIVGKYQELIYWRTDQYSNYDTINANINSFYSIY